ncbi:hypothetical protein DUNSADRAFT_15572 [Dunaliella salina]|uniref:Uncharacterized protein n=1 Tax=Dunaliella salina TaxID=3046 RepID=A0ABQ7G544_DUNSA|nr:hypothetical protein DUNSADRAFT_15572 [Dunaliella salina]|eukprot:KAF5829725.1 hypothetical protein DUNSADRAFT_15572 [Dunaliella salina]
MGLIRNLTMFTLSTAAWITAAPYVTQWNFDTMVERKLAAFDEAVRVKALNEAHKADPSHGGH